MTRRQVFTVCFFAAVALLLYQLALVFQPFLWPALWAAILAHLAMPAHVRLARLAGGRDGVAAALLTAAIMVLGVVPVLILGLLLVREVGSAYAALTEWIRAGGMQQLLGELGSGTLGGPLLQPLWSWSLVTPEKLEAFLLQSGRVLSEFVVNQAAGLVTNAFRLAADFFVMIFTLFVLFRDGRRLYAALYQVIPLDHAHKQRIFTRLDETLRAVVKGVLLTAVVQGLLAGVAYATLGAPFPVFLTAMTMVLAPLPFGGTALVWAPVALSLYWAGPLWKALVMLGWGAGVVTLADNILKPLVIGQGARIPAVAVFFGVLGGLAVYGLIGIFLGPILVALLLTALEIYREEYLPQDEPAGPAVSGS
ncbi:AI-2E family transporter [Nitrospira sp. Kam-Ns4a]